MSTPRWYRKAEVAAIIQRSRRTTERLLRPYRNQCRLTRELGHPRLLLRVPEAVVRHLQDRLSRRKWPEPMSRV